MGNADHPGGRRSLLPVVILVLLPVVYIGALGPLAWLDLWARLPDAVVDVLEVVYWPLSWIETNTDFFERPPGSVLYWYVGLFDP